MARNKSAKRNIVSVQRRMSVVFWIRSAAGPRPRALIAARIGVWGRAGPGGGRHMGGHPTNRRLVPLFCFYNRSVRSARPLANTFDTRNSSVLFLLLSPKFGARGVVFIDQILSRASDQRAAACCLHCVVHAGQKIIVLGPKLPILWPNAPGPHIQATSVTRIQVSWDNRLPSQSLSRPNRQSS